MNKEELEKEVITEYVMLYCQATNRLTEEIIKNQELQERIQKAIEDIEHSQNYGKEKITYINGDDLLDILKGEE